MIFNPGLVRLGKRQFAEYYFGYHDVLLPVKEKDKQGSGFKGSGFRDSSFRVTAKSESVKVCLKCEVFYSEIIT
jgi:hypothetical protein